MKRILFMHQTSSIGGGSYCLLNLVKAIDKSLFEPIVALKSEGPLAVELRKLGVEVVFFRKMAAIPYNRGLLQRGSLGAYCAVEMSKGPLKRLLEEYRIEVLYLNNMLLCRYLQPAKECRCITVVHVREHWPLDEHKHQLEWARKCVYKYADKLIAINHYSAKMFPQKDATIVYDWIDMDSRYKPIPLSEIFGEEMIGKKVLLYTGGTSFIKGVDYILKAFTESLKDDNYRLLMLGCETFLDKGRKHFIKLFLKRFGYKYWGYELQEMIEKDKRIRNVKGVYELRDIIEQSHCFISYFRIPHANLAMAECLALGIPCIAADTDEAREYCGDGTYACLVKPLNDLTSFTKQCHVFLNNIDEWHRAAQHGKKVIAHQFAPEHNIAVLNEALRVIID